MSTYTHVGCRVHVGYAVSGWRSWGHQAPNPGKRHALTGGPKRFTALCGRTVELVARNDYGEPCVPNVRRVDDPEARPVTCGRCRKVIAAARKADAPGKTPAV